ncbi:hypothetical protein PVAG01_02940 [Phlyctema vagabunda]|uniref:C3H1-type domain-containing protein n=1 Tax=Phlyctema vagabunda TaxID=108571 RepID=A0ABR4PS06_9HELO
MAVCKFFQQGTCRFGEKCKFEHPGSNSQQNYNNYNNYSNHNNHNNNRFAALDHYSPNDRNSGYQNGRRDNQARSQEASSDKSRPPYNLDKEAIILDLGSERPQWPLSAYGPGRMAPVQLFGGPLREQSPEEMRLLHYMAAADGNAQQAIQEADTLVRNAEQQTQVALNNVDGAIDFIVKGENEHPNRLDVIIQSQEGPLGNNATASPFVQPNTTSTNAFGVSPQPSTNPFGAPAQPAMSEFNNTAAGAFGQSGAIGQKSTPFGNPQPAFGATSQLGGGGAFGQTSALGQKPNPFGPPSGLSAPGTTSGFSAFSGATNAFGQPTLPTTSNAFNQPPPPTTSNPFGGSSQAASVFGQNAQPTTTSVFGQQQNPAPLFGQAPQAATPNVFGQQPNPTGAFGQLNQAAAPTFGAPDPPKTSAFAQPSLPAPANPFGQTPGQANPFGQPLQPAPPDSSPEAHVYIKGEVPMEIVEPVTNGNADFGQNRFGVGPITDGGQQPSPYAPNSSFQHPSISSYSSKDGAGRLVTFKRNQVRYKDGEPGTVTEGGNWEKIWFPVGAPIYYQDTELPDSAYDEPTRMAYAKLRETGVFEGGAMPTVPPKREWCLWDF